MALYNTQNWHNNKNESETWRKKTFFLSRCREKNLVFKLDVVVAKSFSYYYGVVDFHRRGSDFIRIPDLARTASCWDSLNGIVSSALPYQTLEKIHLRFIKCKLLSYNICLRNNFKALALILLTLAIKGQQT